MQMYILCGWPAPCYAKAVTGYMYSSEPLGRYDGEKSLMKHWTASAHILLPFYIQLVTSVTCPQLRQATFCNINIDQMNLL